MRNPLESWRHNKFYREGRNTLIGGIIMLATSGTIFEATTHCSEPVEDTLNKAIATVQNYSPQPIKELVDDSWVTPKDLQSLKGFALPLVVFGVIFTGVGVGLMKKRSYESHSAKPERIRRRRSRSANDPQTD